MHLATLLASSAFAGVALCQSLTEVIQSQEDLSTLLSALEAIPDLATALAGLSDITILAPTNEAFAALPPDTQEGIAVEQQIPEAIRTLIAYHVLDGSYPASAASDVPVFVPTFFNSSYAIGGTVRTNVTGGQNVGILSGEDGGVNVLSGELDVCQVVQADISAGDGIIIHKIDSVLTIPLNVTESATRTNNTAFVGAIFEAGLAETLDIVDDLTVFIPNNEAFLAAAPVLEGASLEELTSALSYHAITGSVLFSPDLSNTTVATVEGSELTITILDGAVFVDNAQVVLPNLLLSNGVAHIIDSVLIPGEPVEPSPAPPASNVTTTSASSNVTVPFTSAGIEPSAIITVPDVLATANAVPTSPPNATTSGVAQYTGAATAVRIDSGMVAKGGAALAAAIGLMY